MERQSLDTSCEKGSGMVKGEKMSLSTQRAVGGLGGVVLGDDGMMVKCRRLSSKRLEVQCIISILPTALLSKISYVGQLIDT